MYASRTGCRIETGQDARQSHVVPYIFVHQRRETNRDIDLPCRRQGRELKWTAMKLTHSLTATVQNFKRVQTTWEGQARAVPGNMKELRGDNGACLLHL